MSKIQANSQSLSPTPSSVQLSTTLNVETGGYARSSGRDSAYATPAPELQTPVLASSSTLDIDPITVDDGPTRSINSLKKRAGYRPFPDVEAVAARTKRRAVAKDRLADEEDAMTQTATRLASRLAEDHDSVLYPDVDTPFTDVQDVQDLDATIHRPLFSSLKGKSKATEADYIREEMAETRFAIKCWQRRTSLEERFRRARIEEGKRASPGDQAYVLAQAVLEGERAETVATNAELRAARSELDKLERERRAAAPPPPPPTTPRQTSYYPTPSAPTAYTSQYRGYAYPYATPYGAAQYTLSPAFQTAASYSTALNSAQRVGPAYGSAYAPATPTSATSHTTAYSPSTPVSSTPAASSPQAHYRPHTSNMTNTTPTISAIPVQLPVTHLPALKAIGLDPVPITSLPPASQPRPAAILRSQTATTMQIDINVASLQPAQMNGLALILNTLTSRGVAVDGSTAPNTNTAVGNGAPTAVPAATDATTT
ncbi:uncharacterized protein B0H18DRAFT_975898 [Fomitopsis serialis]|uniref:uncharacterized protein n=1 Tax=Fomitopsis serialis TaxID=139415 RepID=UPI0020084AD0|nr:uncharacterized protein B0H18DRAFT_975898 [Neoantrodia serialis]KAH9935487.1 hypothetical protein B0H18DRAFT_975898 [Neoantrodia serialis]